MCVLSFLNLFAFFDHPYTYWPISPSFSPHPLHYFHILSIQSTYVFMWMCIWYDAVYSSLFLLNFFIRFRLLCVHAFMLWFWISLVLSLFDTYRTLYLVSVCSLPLSLSNCLSCFSFTWFLALWNRSMYVCANWTEMKWLLVSVVVSHYYETNIPKCVHSFNE